MKHIINFLKFLASFMANIFVIRKIKIKPLSPWVINSISKSSKRKQKLNEKFLYHTTLINEANYKAYKNLFRT